jgi:hypothetical protein
LSEHEETQGAGSDLGAWLASRLSAIEAGHERVRQGRYGDPHEHLATLVEEERTRNPELTIDEALAAAKKAEPDIASRWRREGRMKT